MVSASDSRPDRQSTRERILDVALDLFVDQGYERTSLREIAERMGFTKAALYYHFASKEDILLELHLRLHALGTDVLAGFGDVPADPEHWSAFLGSLIDVFVNNRKLLVLHERNMAALRDLNEGRHRHDGQNEDLIDAFRRILSNRGMSARDRIRLGATMGAIFSGVLLASTAFEDISSDELAAELQALATEILTRPAPPPPE